jgi:two-component system NtrC family response regulator
MENGKLLIVEDDEEVRTQMKWALAGDYQVLVAEDRMAALEIFRVEKPAVVTLDLGLPPHPAGVEEGFAALAEMLTLDPQSKIIVITGRGEKENALKAIGQGAFDFLVKPIDLNDLKVLLKRGFYLSSLEREHRQLQSRLFSEGFEGMIGRSPKMQEAYQTIRKVAASEVPVLIVGESGTGKELAARAIHQRSPRKEGPFVVINCGAIPETLLESELFGHEKGSYTGAHIQRRGRIELSQGGTLFLDEVGELPLSLQVKLLRFLQEKTIERIGGRQTIQVDTRIIAATNRDLREEMRTGKFREDLYFRLAVLTIQLPPLRERGEDIILLAQAFLDRFAMANQKKIKGFTPEALQALQGYAWPGNIRELENRVKRATIMAEGSRVTAEDLELRTNGATDSAGRLKEARAKLEKKMIQEAIWKNRGNITQAAKELGVSRPTLYELMAKFNLIRDPSKEEGIVARIGEDENLKRRKANE